MPLFSSRNQKYNYLVWTYQSSGFFYFFYFFILGIVSTELSEEFPLLQIPTFPLEKTGFVVVHTPL